MSTYTDFHFEAALSKDTPPKITQAINAAIMYLPDTVDTDSLPKFFQCPRWIHCIIWNEYEHSNSDILIDDFGNFELTINTSFKNNDSEIAHFIDMITPYVIDSPNEYIGWSQSEDEKVKTFYYKQSITHG